MLSFSEWIAFREDGMGTSRSRIYPRRAALEGGNNPQDTE